MSLIPSADARAVVRALSALTTQVRRIADGASTPVAIVSDAPTTTADDGPCAQHPTAPVIGGRCGGCTIYPADMGTPRRPPMDPVHILGIDPSTPDGVAVQQAPAADEDAQRTARRASLRVILDRASRGVILRTDEAALLRQHVDAEQREADQWRAGRHTMKRRGEEIERERDRLADELEQAQAAIDRVRKLIADDPSGIFSDDEIRAALDGTEQPTTTKD